MVSPQARAPERPGGRPVRLGERVEDLCLVSLVDADSGIADFKFQTNLLQRVLVNLYPDYYFSALGELQGIAREIHDDLPQPPGVSPQHVGDLRRDAIGNF